MLTGPVPREWKIDLNKSPGVVRRGAVKEPKVTFTVSDKHLTWIGKGEMSLQAAFIQGHLQIDGDSTMAMKLGTILSKLEKM
ncbi:MAG: SCP2 sterol-binding domain-containing protein [Bacteroidota bacterium]